MLVGVVLVTLCVASGIAGCAPPSPTERDASTADVAPTDTTAPPDAPLDDAATTDTSPVDAPDPRCATLADRLAAAVARGHADGAAGGASLAVITPACGRWAGASGLADETTPLRADHVMRIGSVTKTYVAAVVLQLAAEGRLNLDDPVERYVSGVPGGATVTLRQLLNHTSGVFNYTDDRAFGTSLASGTSPDRTPAELLAIAAMHPAYFAPGAGWHYSNTDYIALGMVVERVTGSTIAAEIRRRLLAPRGLASTYFDGPEMVPAGSLARGYSGSGVDVTSLGPPSLAWAAGAIAATPSDVASWAAQLYAGDVLSAASRMEMLTFVDTGQPDTGYGLGVLRFPLSATGTPAVGHDGSIWGFRSVVLYLTEAHATIAVVVSNESGDLNSVVAGALSAVRAVR